MRYLSILLTFLLLLVIAPAEAIQVNGIAEILSLADLSGDCGQTTYTTDENYQPTGGLLFEVNTTDVVGVTADRLETPIVGYTYEVDTWIVVIFDAIGNPIGGTRYGIAIGQTWAASNSYAGAIPQVRGWAAPEARPFIMKVYDTDGNNPSPDWTWDIIAYGDVVVSAPFDPSPASAACAALPEGDPYNFTVQPVPRPVDPEDTVGEETGLTPSGTSLSIYNTEGGNKLDFYAVDGNSQGYYLTSITASEIPAGTPAENTLIKSSGDLSVWHLSTGEVQVNWTNAEGKTFVYVFDGVPYSSVYSYVIDPNPLPEATPEVGT